MSGAVIRELAADGTSYTLTFRFGTMRQAEQAMGKPVFEALQSGLGMNEISAIVWAALQPAHPMSQERADALLDEARLPDVVAMLAGALQAFFGADAAAEGNASPKPTKKAASRQS